MNDLLLNKNSYLKQYNYEWNFNIRNIWKHITVHKLFVWNFGMKWSIGDLYAVKKNPKRQNQIIRYAHLYILRRASVV